MVDDKDKEYGQYLQSLTLNAKCSYLKNVLEIVSKYKQKKQQEMMEMKLVKDMSGPNGLAVTNDNKYLIVAPLKETIDFNMKWNVDVPLADGMEIYNDEILLAICPNGICLIDLKCFKIVGRLSIDHLISNIHVYDGYIYVTGADNLFRIKLTA